MRSLTILNTLENHVKNTPDKIIFRYIVNDLDAPKIVTFKELDCEIKKVASILQKEYKQGDRALLLYSAGLDFIYAFFGCLYAGIIAVPAYPPRKNQKADRLKSLIEDSDAKVVLTTKKIYEISKNIFEEDKYFVNMPSVTTDDIVDYNPFKKVLVESKDLAFLQYTSGSTGSPKGVMINHTNIMHNMKIIYQSFGHNSKSIIASWLPHFHDMGLIGGVLQPIYAGCQAVLMSPTYFLQKPIRWLNIISKYKVTSTGSPNFGYELCVNTCRMEELEALNLDLSSWYAAQNGAEPILYDTIQRFTEKFSKYGFNEISHQPCYGMAESTLLISNVKNTNKINIVSLNKEKLKANIIQFTNKKVALNLVSCGYVWEEDEVIIVNDKTFEKLEENRVGEIWVKGRSIAQGYWGDKEKTKEIFHAYTNDTNEGPYLKTGDLGFIHKGELYVCGRVKDLIIIRGRNYYPQDIELSAYSSHEALVDMGAAVFSIEDDGSEKLIIIQEIKRTYIRKCNKEEIFKSIREAVALEHELEVYDIVLLKPGKLLKTSSGKIQRYKNKKAYLDVSLEYITHDKIFTPSCYVAPRNQIEIELVKIFEEVLNMEKVGICDNFFELGGNSLLITQIISKIKNQLNVDITFSLIFNAATIESLSKQIAEVQTYIKYPILTKSSLNIDTLPLTKEQERLWFLDKKSHSYDYNLPLAVKIGESLNKQEVFSAFEVLMQRHDSLRIVFKLENNFPKQQVLETMEIDISYVDLSNEDKKIDRAKELCREKTKELFDLEKGPLFKLLLLKLGSKDSVLFINIHHIVSDETSLKILLDEFIIVINELKNEKIAVLPELQLGYKDYSLWQKELFDKTNNLEQEKLFWKEELSIISKPLDLNRLKKESSSVCAPSVKIISKDIDFNIYHNIENLKQKHNVTSTHILFAFYVILLHKYTGQKSIIIAVPVNLRNTDVLNSVVGFFINTILLKIEITPQSSYLDIIQQVKKKFLSGFENRYLPTQDIISIIRENKSSFSVEDVPCSFNSTTFPVSSFDKMDYNILDLEPISSKTSITMWMNEYSNKISINWEYDATKLDNIKMNQFINHYIELLKKLKHPNSLIYKNILFREDIFIENKLDDKVVKDIYPLSNIQREIYFEGEISYQGNYPIGSYAFLDNSIDITIIRRVIDYIFEKIFIHNIRVTTYNNEVYQYIIKESDFKKNILKLNLIEGQNLENEIFILAKKNINLKEGSLLKVVLIYKNDIPHAISWISHHVLLDGLSVINLNILTKKIYDTFIKKQVFIDFKIETIYNDFERVIKKEVVENSDFWEKALDGAQTPPFFNREKLGDLEKYDLYIKKEELLRLKNIQKEYKISTFSILIGCYISLLHRIYNFENDIIIYEPSTTRESLRKIYLGVYVDIIPLIIRKVWLENNNLIELIKNIEKYRLLDKPNISMGEQSKLIAAETIFEVNYIPTFNNEIYPAINRAAKNEVLFSVIPSINKTILLRFSYHNNFFNGINIKDKFNLIYHSFLNQVSIKTFDISLLTPEEEQQLLVEYNDTKVDYPKDKTIHQLFEVQVKLNPENIAVVYEEEELTYKQLNTKSNQLAHYLIEQGVEPDSLIAIYVDRSLDMMIGLLAILKAGGAYVPIDPSYPEDRIKHMLEDSSAKLLLTQAHLEAMLPKTKSQTITIDTLDISKEKTSNPQTKVNSSNLAYVIYTSGSTGLPKGVMVEHGGVVNLVNNEIKLFDIINQSIMLQFFSYGFDFSVSEVFNILSCGGKLAIPTNEQRMPGKLEFYIEKLNITHAFIPPAVLVELKHSNKLKSLQLINVGGDICPLSVANKWYKKVKFFNTYGPTEATVDASYFIYDKKVSGNSLPIGRPINNTQLYILDKYLNPVPKGVAGELHIAGDGLARGYLNQPELTKEKFIDNPFTKGTRLYKTGDLVRYLEDGNIEYIGRVDDQVKIRGLRIELGEIEQQLLKIESVKESVVLAREDENGNKSLVAYITTKENQEIESSSIKSMLLEHLPEYMVPVAYKSIESMPLTPNGKVDKKALAKLEVEIQSSKEYVAPRNEIEEKLAKIFQEVLNVEKVGIYDNFFELGGHSLLATQLVSRIRSGLEIDLPLKELFGTPTIEHLSEYLQTYAAKSNLSKIPLQKDRDNLKLSYAQERLWFLDKFEGGKSIAYHMPAILKLEGSLNKKVLSQALTTIVERHEALRTNFIEKDNEALQIIGDIDTFTLEEILCKEGSVNTKIKEALSKPFNLESDMLFKAVLYSINKETHYLLVNMHHIISDGWSIGVLIQEFVTLYNAYSDNQVNPLPPLEIQYGDYAAWQKEYLSGEVLEEKLSYWKETLGGIEPLALPTTYPRPAIQSNKGNTLSFTINKEITKKLNALSKKYDATLFMVLLSSFGLLMHKYSGQEELIIGSPIANRNRSEIEPLIGFFVNTLALKQDFSSDMKFSTVLQQTKEHTLSAYDHQDVPFEKIVEALNIPRDTSRSPLFQVMFALQNNPENSNLELVNLNIEGVEFENPTSKFDLTMDITESNEELQGSLEYATDLFNREYIEAMIEHFKILLEAIVQDETQAISKYPLLTQQEEQQLLIEYNNTNVAYPKNNTLHQLFEEQVKLNPENIAVVYEEEELTYKQLNSKSNQLAHYLIEQGVKPDSLVAICVDRSLDMMIGLLAILKAGGAYVPIDPTYPEDRIKHMLDDTQAKLLLTQEHFKNILLETKSKIITIDTLDTNKEKSTNPKTEVSSRNLAYVIYTSGSSGLPKGVMVEHVQVVNLVQWHKHKFKISKISKATQVASFSFDAAVWEMFPYLLNSAQLVILPKDIMLNIELLVRYLSWKNITHAFIPTALSQQFLEKELSDKSSLKYIFLGGEKLDTYKYNKKYLVSNNYGPTECTVVSLSCILKSEFSIPIGRPINNTQLYILDKYLNPVPKGVAGELHIAGDGLARGYLNQPELTKEKFIDNPFTKGTRLYKTGDLVRYLEDGNIEYIGRVDDQVKIRGLRIELGEIEQQLLKIESVKESVVLAREDENGNKSLVAYITTKENQEIESSSIKSMLLEHLPEYMVPVAYKSIESMPLTPNGKVDKKALAKLEVEIQSSKEYVAPRNEIEEKLAKIFQEVLNVEKVGIYDNFFELGGHSLLATQLVSRIRSGLEIELPLHYIFIESTIASFYDAIIERKKYKSILVPLEKDGASTPIFAMHGLGGNAQQFKKLSNLLGKKQPMYAFQDVIFEEESMDDISVKNIAKKNISLIKDIYPKGPYVLIGHSMGGWVAYEMALMLEQEGYTINSLILLDCYIPELINFGFENIDLVDKFNGLNISYEKYLKLRDMYINYEIPTIQLNCNIYLFIASQNNLKKENIDLWKNIDSKIIIKELQGNHFSILTSERLVDFL